MPEYQDWSQPCGPTPGPDMTAPGIPVPPGMYYDAPSGLLLPNGTVLASHGRRVGAYFLAWLLWIVTLFIGYAIWGLVTWRAGRTPVQQVLGMRCWNTREMTTASWLIMLARGLCMWVIDSIAFGGLVSFILFLVNRDRKTLYDLIAGTVVLYDPDHVLGQDGNGSAGQRGAGEDAAAHG